MKFMLTREEREFFEEGIIKPFKVTFSSRKNVLEASLIGISFVVMYFSMIILADIVQAN